MPKALIVVDVQNDFLPGGSLAVPSGDEVINPINQLIEAPFDVIVATQEWHPRNHGSFAATHRKHVGETISLNGIPQILWPTHCVQNSSGADFSPLLHRQHIDHIVHKGTDPNIDSYSTFYDNGHIRSTGLTHYLRAKGITDVYLAGLATDYCVKYSALDSLKDGFHTFVVIEGCRGINLKPNDTKEALDTIQRAGGVILPHVADAIDTLQLNH